MKEIRTIAAVMLLAAAAVAARAAEPEFPTAGLESRIEFWKQVFTQYGKDDILIHDTYHVNLIYDVASDADVAGKKAAVREALQELRSTLDTPQQRSENARRIAQLMAAAGVSLTAGSLSERLEDIHTQRGIKELFRDGLVRSGRYIDEFREILKAAGVPEDLALLPLVESAFQNARSKAGAVGIWQFTRSTGRLYMKVGAANDERLDPIKATRAAAKLLRGNYDALGGWPLAITAYNHGRAGMQRAKKQVGSEITSVIAEYKSPLFGYASMNFYTEFLAAVDVYKNHSKYFADLVFDRPAPRSNPNAPQVAAIAKAPVSAKPQADDAERYRVRKGDTLSEVASRFGTTIRSLMELNGLKKSVIYAGQILLVP